MVNLTVFETFFPEKRPFFVEGADAFRFGGGRASNSFDFPEIFFSRRIGREPQRSVTGEGVSFLDAPTETSIYAVAKLSGRTQSGWSIGVLDAVTASSAPRAAGFATASTASSDGDLAPSPTTSSTRSPSISWIKAAWP